MGTPATLLDLIAHGGSLRAMQDNSAQVAQTNEANQRAAVTRAQVPLVQQQTEEARLRNQVTQRQLRDEEIQRSIFGEVGKSVSAPPAQQSAPSPVAPQGAPVPGMAGVTTDQVQPTPQIATPAFNPGAPAANAGMVPDYLSNPRSFANEMARRGASAPAVMGAFKTITDLNKNLAGLSKDQLEVEAGQHAQVAASLQGYLNTPDEQKPQAYAQFYQDAVTREPNLKQELPPPGSAPTQDDLAHVIGKVHLFGTLLDNAKKKQDTATSAAQQKEAEASTAAKGTENQINTIKLNNLKSSSPEQANSRIDALIDKSKYPLQNMRAKSAFAFVLQNTGDAAKAAEAVEKISGEIGDVQKEDLMRPGKVQTAVDTAKATAPIEVSKAIQTAYGTIGAKVKEQVDAQKALALNAPGSFSGIIEPTARHAAEQEYDKATDTYHDKAMAAQNLRSLISAAQGGNKAAPGLIPLAELRSFVSRVNRSELQNVSGAGSSLDKIEGWISGHTEGQPIPQDILKATKEIADIQEKDASQRYDLAISKLKQKGANPPRIELPGAAHGITVKAGDGSIHPFTSEAEAAKFEGLVKAHGGTTSRQ